LSLREGRRLWQKLQASLPKRGRRVQRLEVDVTDVTSVDGAAAALLANFRAQVVALGVECEFVGATTVLSELLRLHEDGIKPRRRKRRRPIGLLAQIGAATLSSLKEAQSVIAFFGQMVVGVVLAVRAPRTFNWKELLPTMERAGADAAPIVALINLLVGMVIALQSAGQLHRFGADLYMADLVGISILREIGPLMTAILVCGRTGAAFAAELGSMKTNEEVDALLTMGFGTMRFLVMPRVLALMLVVPMLTLVADLAGSLGGLAVGVWHLGLTVSGYANETMRAVHLRDFGSGLIKSVAFAVAIGLISCQQGLAATGGAEGVGRRTTSAVVTTLFSLIVIDAVFTVFFEATRHRS
jgi:phospholipid/cholesterol/gamma-HCH transport system permease protein